MSGKGSTPRPLSIPYREYCDRWDEIFRKRKKKFRKEVGYDGYDTSKLAEKLCKQQIEENDMITQIMDERDTLVRNGLASPNLLDRPINIVSR